MAENNFIRWFDELNSEYTSQVGGKNASLGEMISNLKSKDIRVPDGFATTADAYRLFLETNEIEDKIRSLIGQLKNEEKPLASVGKEIRRLFYNGTFPEQLDQQIREAYVKLSEKYESAEIDVAVRSSATAEDLPEASFAGQQETFLNVTGADELLDSCKKCFASLFTDRAISYRTEKKFDHMKVALSVGVQNMVRSDLAGAGVMFTIDTETGFPDVVLINAAWGLGENVVQGTVNPDEYRIYKPLIDKDNFVPIIEKNIGSKERKMVYSTGTSETTKNVGTSHDEQNSLVLNDQEIITLARWAAIIEDHYGKPMDTEWAKDGRTGELFIVQARPETVQSQKQADTLKSYSMKEKGEVILEGLSIGQAIAAGKAQVIKSSEQIGDFQEGSILVTGMTDPDWVPIMKKAAAIVTDHGGRTSHAAIVSRELGIPAIVGTTNATKTISSDREITVSCAEGDTGFIYDGKLEYDVIDINFSDLPKIRTQLMINIASPSAVFRWWQLPVEGIGLARMEFIINNIIKIHPMALVDFKKVEDAEQRKQIEKLTAGFEDRTEYFVDHLARGLSQIACAFYPKPTIIRTSDFKTNEYAELIGGKSFEPKEQNPMLGFRGASRYYSDLYREGFALECRAIKRARETLGFKNIIVMIPFCRTPEEADKVFDIMAENGLVRGEQNLEVYVMAEIPTNIIQADEFAKRFDGFSIGSNDLTQLTLGIDRDSDIIRGIFDERNRSVKTLISSLIETAHQHDRKVGICGQGPSDYPDFAQFLVSEGIDTISLNPDSVIKITDRIAEFEKKTQTEESGFWKKAGKLKEKLLH